MSEDDRRKWDARYAARRPLQEVAPDRWLVDALASACPVGGGCADRRRSGTDSRRSDSVATSHADRRALDVACGLGHNAIWLALQGWRVTGVDISTVGLQHAQTAAQRAGVAVEWIAADLERWQPPVARFDLVAVFRFWDSVVVPRIAHDVLRPGGLLVLEAFSRRQLNRPDAHLRNPAFTVEIDDVPRLFRGFQLLESRDVDLPDRSVVRLLARRTPDR